MRTIFIRCSGMALLALLAFACIRNAGENPVSPDAAQDEVEIPYENGTSPPGITFILSFTTDDPENEFMFVQTYGVRYCREGWITIMDGETIIGIDNPDCRICRCEEICQSNRCTICACMVTSWHLSSGQSIRLDWNGIGYPVVTCQGDSERPETVCETTGTLAPGAYEARFCWAIGGPDAFPDKIIDDPICNDVAFDYPVPGGIVSYTVDLGG